MTEEQLVHKSKYLSKHLRHSPERIGLTLQEGGWVGVDDLLAACARNSFALSRDELNEVVEKNSKKRFSFDGTGARIRASQGHSVEVDLQLDDATPPDVLYHGTGHNSVAPSCPPVRGYGNGDASRCAAWASCGSCGESAGDARSRLYILCFG